jgi:hypothetical protein
MYTQESKWDYVNPGWHQVSVIVEDSKLLSKKYDEIVDWLEKNIDKCERHCRITVSTDTDDRNLVIKAKFRYERDYEWFHLTWV